MEPRIRFAQAADGTAIAFWREGSGPNLLHLPWLPWGHVQLECEDPDIHLWYERLAGLCSLIRYDGRGAGLSDHESADYGVRAQIMDIEGVRQRLGLEQLALLASLNMGPAAITYAVEHPERVSHLILWCTYASSIEYNRHQQVKAIRSLLYSDWDLYTETGAHAFVGWTQGAHHLAELMRQSTTPDRVKAFYRDMEDVDCAGLLPRVKVPVLVMHPRQFPLYEVSVARHIAATIPDARFRLFEGASLSPTRGDLEGVLAAVAGFLAESPESPGPSPAQPAVPDQDNQDGLSAREVEILRLVAKGLTNKGIADFLVLSPRTVERHIENIYAKIGVNNRVQAAAYAKTNHLE